MAPTLALGVRESFTGAYTQDSHELRLATDAKAVLSGQAGLYYFREKSAVLYAFQDLEPLGLPPYYVFPHGPNVARSRAVFGQGNWRVTDALRLTIGARTTSDFKSRVGSTNFQQTATFNPRHRPAPAQRRRCQHQQNHWRIGADVDVNPSTLLYGTVSTGYKAGGFNDGCVDGATPQRRGLPGFGSGVPAASTLVYQPGDADVPFEAGHQDPLPGRAARR